MLFEKITEEELAFMELWHDPIALSEALFSNFDNLADFDNEKLGEVRQYQVPFLSFEPTIDKNVKGLNKKENFKLRKGVGDIYNFGARNYGKSLITEKLDIPISMIHDEGDWVGFTSCDDNHIRGVLDPIKSALDSHPILSEWKRRVTTHPAYKIEAKNGWLLDGVNMKLNAKVSGANFFGKHFKKLWIEEASLETEQVYGNRKEAGSELGMVTRSSGMTNFTKFMPAGKAFYDFDNKSKIINLPQYVNPFWDSKEKEDRIKQYGGEEALLYKIFVEGKVVEDGVSEFDMERVKECFLSKKKVKRFEISKDRFARFDNYIVVERPKNVERIFICADIGESAGTNIIVVAELNGKYKWLYDVVLYNLTHLEQLEVFKFLINKLNANVIGIDCGDGLGRSLYGSLEKIYPKENLVWYAGAEKIDVDFEKDKSGKIVMKKGKPVYRQEFMSEWSIRRLKTLLYEIRLRIPYDPKFENQIASVISMQSGTRVRYACVSQTGDHLLDSWRVFSIAEWLKKAFNKTPAIKNDWGSGACSWTKKDKNGGK